ncbi:hypothetical protein AB3X52_17945 [Nocardioides sp. DS6]|uniref:Uncharacterized protein n=1 Tax=Nocardioides eburneus TaxID=3231482 RepID=A0ABV3T2S3_9ACTN
MSAFDPYETANEADIEEQEQGLDEENPDEEAIVGSDAPPRRDDVDEADYQEQTEPVPGSDDDYPYDEE